MALALGDLDLTSVELAAEDRHVRRQRVAHIHSRRPSEPPFDSRCAAPAADSRVRAQARARP